MSIPGFFFLSFCVLLISDLSSRSSPVPALSSKSPPSLFSVLTSQFFFQFCRLDFCPTSLSPCSANLSPLLGHFSPSQGHFPPSKSFPPPQGWFPPPSRLFPPLKDQFFENPHPHLQHDFPPSCCHFFPLIISFLPVV